MHFEGSLSQEVIVESAPLAIRMLLVERRVGEDVSDAITGWWYFGFCLLLY
jgi:hypothetical protein